MRQLGPFVAFPLFPWPFAFLAAVSCSPSESESESLEDEELLLLSESLDDSDMTPTSLVFEVLSSKPSSGIDPGAFKPALGLLLRGDLA